MGTRRGPGTRIDFWKNIILIISRRVAENYLITVCASTYLCIFVLKTKENCSISTEFLQSHLKKFRV